MLLEQRILDLQKDKGALIDYEKILTTMENNMNVKFTIIAVILLLMFTSCIKLDEEISKETVFVTTTIVSKHYEEPKTELKYQFVMGKYQWLPSTEPAHYYVDYEYVLEDASIKRRLMTHLSLTMWKLAIKFSRHLLS